MRNRSTSHEFEEDYKLKRGIIKKKKDPSCGSECCCLALWRDIHLFPDSKFYVSFLLQSWMWETQRVGRFRSKLSIEPTRVWCRLPHSLSTLHQNKIDFQMHFRFSFFFCLTPPPPKKKKVFPFSSSVDFYIEMSNQDERALLHPERGGGTICIAVVSFLFISGTN